MNISFYKTTMTLLLKVMIGTLGSGLFLNASYCQSPTTLKVVPSETIQPDTSQLDFSQDVASQLIPFENIYEVAVSSSPLVKLQNELVISQNAAYRLSKLEILSRISGFANFSNGNQGLLLAGAGSGDALGQITNGYRTGINASISLYELFGRPQQIRQARANSQTAIIQKDIAKLQLRRELITVYQDLITSQQILKVRIRDEQISFSSFQIIEIAVRQGQKSPEELAASSNRFAQAKTFAEEARGNFLKNAYYLETLTGVPIQQLKSK